MTRAQNNRGFTLIEIMVAVAILATSLMILLECHYSALRLFNDAREETLMQQFLNRALGDAEVQVLAGTLSGAGDFGQRYPNYDYSFQASPVGEDETVPLYDVTVTINGPDDSRSMEMFVYSVESTY